MNENEMKRVFFAFEVHAPWPDTLPSGRVLEDSARHMTFAFLGETYYPTLEQLLPECPKPRFKVGKAGIFNKCLFLPERHPNVVAWHLDWLDDASLVFAYYDELISWLNSRDVYVSTHKEGFLPHVTLSRKPFQISEWKRAFSPLPMFIKNLHLYESLGQLHYRPCWTHPLHAPFEELEHTADIAFLVRGETILEIYHHASTALAFLFPTLLDGYEKNPQIESLDDVIIQLNSLISIHDQDQGCPFKAVSFHGHLNQKEDKTLEWEMIVDV